jgi:hypothetical protein
MGLTKLSHTQKHADGHTDHNVTGAHLSSSTKSSGTMASAIVAKSATSEKKIYRPTPHPHPHTDTHTCVWLDARKGACFQLCLQTLACMGSRVSVCLDGPGCMHMWTYVYRISHTHTHTHSLSLSLSRSVQVCQCARTVMSVSSTPRIASRRSRIKRRTTSCGTYFTNERKLERIASSATVPPHPQYEQQQQAQREREREREREMHNDIHIKVPLS